jgi:aminoglycoside phosphotransferase (APT) family kinase protein
VHGSPHPEQWLLDGDRLGLVDFDGLALADPELDASAMLVALERDAAIEHLAAPFLDAYESAAGPLRPGLLAVHRAQRWLAAAHKAARQPRPDGDRRAAERLRRALTIVEEGR